MNNLIGLHTGLITFLFAWMLFGLPVPTVADHSSDSSTPNIVLIYADDLGYGDVSCYGANEIETPNIDRLAKNGLRFTDAHSPSATCTPSRYAMLTGQYAWRKKGTGIARGDAALIIDPAQTTLSKILKSAGYRTAVVGKWHLGLGDGDVDWNGEIKPGPLELGYDHCFLIPATGDRVPCVYVEDHQVVGLDPDDPIHVSFNGPIGEEPTGKLNPDQLTMRPSHGHDMTIINGISRIGYMSGGFAARWKDEDMADTITGKAVEFIESQQEDPFFLFFSLHDIHVPRVPHPRFVGKSGMGPRGDAILQTDWCVGQIVSTLEEQGLLENTLIVFTSDNGPVVDDGYQDQAVEKLGDHRPAGPWRGGKYSNYEGGTRVPFIVHYPAGIKPGKSDALTCQIDLPASFAELVGYSLKSEDAPDSYPILDTLLGKDQQGRDHLIEHAGRLSLRSGSWKVIRASQGQKVSRHTNTELGNNPTPMLFNLATDPGEENDLAEQEPERLQEMLEKLKEIEQAGRSRPADSATSN